jgi:hypothetical protein
MTRNSTRPNRTAAIEDCRQLHLDHFGAQARLTDAELFDPEAGFTATTDWETEYEQRCADVDLTVLSKDPQLRQSELRYRPRLPEASSCSSILSGLAAVETGH